MNQIAFANNRNRNKRIRSLYTNKGEHSYTRVAFRELHLEKKTFRVKCAQTYVQDLEIL